MVVEEEGRWIAHNAIADLEVPTTLQGLLASRIDLLPTDVRRAGLVAAVIGRRFESSLLAAVVARAEPDAAGSVQSNLSDLEAHGLVKLATTRPELAFSFRHALTHDVMYDSILKRERRSLHGQVAEAIELLHSDQLEANAPALARHYAEAGNNDKALEYLLMAGRSALARHALVESHAFFMRAGELLDAEPGTPIKLRIYVTLQQAKSGMKFTPGEQTIAILEAVRSDAESLGDPDLLARVYALLLEVRTMSEETYSDPAYRDTMNRAYALAEDVQHPALRAILEGMMGQVLRSADEYQQAADLLTGSVPVLEEAGRLGAAGLNAAFAADVLAQMGRFEEAEPWIDRGTELAAASGNPNVIADAALLRGRIASGRGELEEALIHTTRGMETAATVGNIHCELVGNFMVADQQLRLGNAGTAIPHLERSFELGEFCNADAMVALGHAWLAAARAQLGEVEPEAFVEPLQQAQAGGSRSGEAMVRLHRGIAIAGSENPDWDIALEDLERAEQLLEDIGARPDQARTAHARAMALEAAGRTDESRMMLDRAMGMFSELGMQPDPIPA
jgi:tetratricopeptide (TPR) repeat protein